MTIKKKQRFAEGEIIFREGSEGDCAFIVESGRVEIFVGSESDPATLSILGVGEIFGEMAVIDGSPRSASAKALEPCEVMSVSSEAISERIHSADSIVQLLVAMLLKRMRQSNVTTGRTTVRATRVPNPMVEQVLIDKIRIEVELKEALVAQEFNLHFQPIIDFETMEISGFEALIRWLSNTRGMVQPDIFMGIAEETSLIVPIGRWVIETACAAHAQLLKEAHRSGYANSLFMTINISGRQFSDPHFFDHLLDTVRQNGLKSEQIKLEITERIFMEGPAAIHAIERSRSHGFLVALDDFGTGFSSLSYLAKFKVDAIKVDKAFVQLLLDDPRTLIITRAIIEMATQLGIPAIAEGVEAVAECAILRSIHCRYGQGYLFSPAIPLVKA